jgi:2-oxoglutarate dehydrogenase E2 component (dihydrolipoamide succinyltransferase)
MAIEVKVPLLPESISDATVSTWYKKEGDQVSRDENLVDLETDKVMLEVPSPSDGIIKQILKKSGSTVHAQEVLAVIVAAEASASKSSEVGKQAAKKETSKEEVQQKSHEATKAEAPASSKEKEEPVAKGRSPGKPVPLSPSARRALAEREGDVSEVVSRGPFERITKDNIKGTSDQEQKAPAPTSTVSSGVANARPEKRVPMSRIRARIAERLLEVSQNTAMLTTFNEINMAPVMEIRKKYREQFEKRYKVRLGLMSFFIRAVVEALKRSPIVNASIDGTDIIYHGYFDIGVAVSTDRGLIVPVLRDADQMSMAEIEIKLAEAAEKARAGKLTLEEMQGGTFTITNGGVFGSLMATPLLNSPQCAILGMHKIEDRVVVENGQIVIRPMMYVALSYDHRLIDGKESVTFLVSVKELLEDPARILLEV